METTLLYFFFSLLASIAGAICGIGGGAIIKPIMDFFARDNISTISFLSGCTVLAMSLYRVGKTMLEKDRSFDIKFCTPLAVGAALGGVGGKIVFMMILQWTGNQALVGRMQSLCMIVITLGAMIYTWKKSLIKTLHCKSFFARILIGMALGVLSSFLGIGGGPVNLVVFYFFFSMDTKSAAKNSLYVILISQFTSLLSTIITNTVPEFRLIPLFLMISGGILGGIVGAHFSKKMNSLAVEKLFILMMGIIIVISGYNAIQ